jgi:hypothetical protein
MSRSSFSMVERSIGVDAAEIGSGIGVLLSFCAFAVDLRIEYPR